MVTLRTRAPGVDLVAAGVPGQPQVRRVANTAALPPTSGGHLGIVEVRTYDRFAIGGQSLYDVQLGSDFDILETLHEHEQVVS